MKPVWLWPQKASKALMIFLNSSSKTASDNGLFAAFCQMPHMLGGQSVNQESKKPGSDDDCAANEDLQGDIRQKIVLKKARAHIIVIVMNFSIC